LPGTPTVENLTAAHNGTYALPVDADRLAACVGGSGPPAWSNAYLSDRRRSEGGLLLDSAAVAVTGAFGPGKSSVVEEMAGVLERAELSYAALDLDWLWWFDADGIRGDARRQILMTNLSAVLGNYLEAGVERFLMAWAIKDAVDLDLLRGAVPMPLHVVRLTVPLDVIRTRLSSSPTTDRQRDLAVAERWIAKGTGTDISDIEVNNDRPIRHVANDILHWLGWL
jgi:hypothetical protein